MRTFMWPKERKVRREKLHNLFISTLDCFRKWKEMLYLAEKIETFTGVSEEEVIEKASVEMEKLYTIFESERKDIPYGARKRLGCLERIPILKVNKTYTEGIVKTMATITYTQYLLKPGFTEEEYVSALASYDKAEEVYRAYRKECYDLGMDV